ncbi:MAG: recombinase family protein [Acidobacteria bacterium]|nr:recombinase family protein [Acidobacteriota bacterium]
MKNNEIDTLPLPDPLGPVSAMLGKGESRLIDAVRASSSRKFGDAGCSVPVKANKPLPQRTSFQRADSGVRISRAANGQLIDVIAYLRVSSNEQKLGFSIEAQRKAVRDYASANGLRIVQIFEIAESASTQGRRVFSAAIEFALANPNVRGIITEKPDRLLRSLDDFNLVEKLVAEQGLEFHFAKDGRVIRRDSNSRERLVHGLHALLAKYYIDNLREETMKGQRVKAGRGEYPGRAPYGYVNDRNDRAIVAHPTRAQIVKQIFEMYATGNYSVKTLRKAIHGETGEKISKSRLHQILKSRFYIGLFTWSEEEYEGNHPALVDEKTFYRVQRLIAGKGSPKGNKHDFAFSGMMFCAECGCKITAELHKEKYTYYHCTFAKGKHGFPWLIEEAVGEMLGLALKLISVPKDLACQIAEFDQNAGANQSARRKDKITHLQQRLNTINTRIDKAYDDRCDGLISEDLWTKKKQEWEAQKADLAVEIEKAEKPDSQPHHLTSERILDLAARAHQIYGGLSERERAETLRMVATKFVTDGETAQPHYRDPFQMILSPATNCAGAATV